MSNLLEKASIVTTPTAYDNGKILSVKPAPSLGSELVTNGTFDTDTDWIKGGAWSISGGTANYNDSTNASLYQNVTLNANIYELKFSISNSSGSGARIWIGNSSGSVSYTDNTYEYYTDEDYTLTINVPSNQTTFAFWGNTGGSSFSIDNVSVKEVIDADFDFTRNSSATRVNSEGLIEDVQILSSNLVSNGDFSQEGSELVTNGNFDTDSDWTTNDWNISGGSLNGSASTGIVFQNNLGVVVGKTYKVVLEISNYTSGLIRFKVGGASYQNIASEDGVQEFYFVAATTANNILFSVQSAYTGSIDNVSVKEVGQDWILGTGVAIGEDRAIFTSTASGQSVSQNAVASSLTNGALAKVSFEVLSITQGSFGVYFSGTLVGTLASAGVFTGYFTKGTETSFYIRALGTTSGSISNISVVEITDDTNLPRINYEGFSYQDSLGSELVTNGDFATDSNWNKINSTISGGTGNLNGTGGVSMLYQNILTNGKTYKVTFTVSDYNSLGEARIIESSGSAIYTITSNGTFTFTFTHSNADGSFLFRARNGAIFSIDNVSVKEYLGQEVVPDSGCGSWLFEPQSTNLVTYSEVYGSGTYFSSFQGSTFDNTTSLSPSGENNATQLTSTGAGKLQTIGISLSQNTDYTLSFYAKNVDATEVQSRVLGLGGSGGSNLIPISYFSELSTTEWKRITHSFNTGTNTTFYLYLSNALNSGGTIQLWGAQIEQSSFATSYIPTNGSTVTRLQDAAFGAGSSDLINSTEGVLYAEIAALANDLTNRRISLAKDANNKINLVLSTTSNTVQGIVISAGAVQFNQSFTISNTTEFNKIAISYAENNFALWINGVKVASDTSGNTFPSEELTTLTFDNATGTNPFYGKTKCVAVFKEALTDEELTCLTTI
jgi:hypothetical protein